MTNGERIGEAYLKGLIEGIAAAHKRFLGTSPSAAWTLTVNGRPITHEEWHREQRRERGQRRLLGFRRWWEPRYSRLMRWLEWQLGR